MKFRLEAPYQPSGDQPEAIDGLVRALGDGVEDVTLLGVTGSGLVQNDGSSPTPAVITISGPFTNPVLTNERTGETISVKYTLSAGEKLIIDTDPQNTAVIFVDAGGTRYAAFNAVTSDSAFWQLLPGENIIHYADSGVIGNVPIRIEWYDRYAGVF